jgi:hypothetical protein
MERRTFLGTLPAAGVAAGQAAALKPPKIWVDPKLAALAPKPWRKIHLDFHNSQHEPAIGEKFNADEFGDRLLAGNVNAVVVFAKDMHGYFYYPSRYGPVHPGLKFDLLAQQVKACRARKIAVYAYYCTTWDNYLADKHREWLVIRRDGGNYLPRPGGTPGWTALCLAYDGFVKLMLAHAEEFVSKYPLDGAWFDMPVPIAGECFCPECLRQLKAKGLDPKDKAVQAAHKHELHKSFIARMSETVRRARPGCQVDYNGQGVLGLGERVKYQDNVDIEALPSGAQWGYYYYPLITRYVRTFGITNYGMTGRFIETWADFGGLKLPAQLDLECASIVANATPCDIGDQMPPTGKLDPAVYHVIGKSYGKIKAIEPYLNQAVPVTEAALLVSGLPLARPSTPANLGWTKLLMENRIQFDAVETGAEWERYGLLILPDELEVTSALAARLRLFIEAGGAVIAAHEGGVVAGSDKSWLEPYGFRYAGKSPFKPAYLVPKEKFTGDIPEYQYALYGGASQWNASSPSVVVAQLGEPLFQRSGAHYTSHRQSPFHHTTEYAAMARSGKVGLIGFPIGQSYFDTGYWVYRDALRHLLRAVHPVPLVETNAPLNTEITVNKQGQRYLVHVVNFSPSRGTPKHPTFHDEPVPLADVTVTLNVAASLKSARCAISGARLVIRRSAQGSLQVTVPKAPVHEIVVFE